MTHNPLLELRNYGQSVWLDDLRRSLVTSGRLKRLVEEDGVQGLTSNPATFEKAISNSGDYDDAVKTLTREGQSAADILRALMVDDIRMAADLFRPVYVATQGADGYASLEVSPRLAQDAEATLEEVRRLVQLIKRPNVMIKIPGTREGISAIRQAVREGFNINITLLFSLERYEEVVEAYLSGLEARAAEGGRLSDIASVASFFVSRVDTAVDKQLEGKLREEKTPGRQEELRSLRGQAALANAKLAYQRFKELFGGRRFLELEAKGAREQRVLWASTSTKDPHYRDVLYVEELIGPQTINTMPESTLEAFRSHGRVAATLDSGLERAKDVLRRLREVGIDMRRVTQELEEQGVRAFVRSYDALLSGLEIKAQAVFRDRPDLGA